MTRGTAGPEIERLIQLLAKLPGLGPRSARKAALTLIKRRSDLMAPLASALAEVAERVSVCPTCGNVDSVSPCTVCRDPGRDDSLIVVVEEVGDLWALERARVVKGRYHVLGGHLSPLDGIRAEDLNIAGLMQRSADPSVREIILALNATVEGQSTAHFLAEELQRDGLSISRLAHGVPVGGELDYLDEGTLAAAIKSRRPA
ncbi:MAG: recombination mediator RecR [Hyphomicrobiaceae bacterium]